MLRYNIRINPIRFLMAALNSEDLTAMAQAMAAEASAMMTSDEAGQDGD